MRDARGRQRGLEVGQARVRAAENRDFLVRHVELTDSLDDEGALVRRLRELGLGPVRSRRAQRLLGAAEPGHQAVRELQHLGRRAVVRLEPDDRRVREPGRHPQEVLRRRTGEGVDRLVVVADDAEIVASAEPEVEKGLLEQVDVLVLVDREGPVALAKERQRLIVLLVGADRQLEQVLEVDEPLCALAFLVAGVHPVHEVGRERRLVVAELAAIALRRNAAVLGPFDLRGEVGERTEPVGAG